MPYSAHYIIYTALSTLYLRALQPVCMFATKLLYNNHLNNKDMDVPFAYGLFSVIYVHFILCVFESVICGYCKYYVKENMHTYV